MHGPYNLTLIYQISVRSFHPFHPISDVIWPAVGSRRTEVKTERTDGDAERAGCCLAVALRASARDGGCAHWERRAAGRATSGRYWRGPSNGRVAEVDHHAVG